MIDVHCHLEQQDYQKDRDKVIEKCKKELKAVITCCAHPEDFKITLEMVDKFKNFVFASVGIHPEYIEEIDGEQVKSFIDLIRKNKDKFVAIGEVGLDYFWIKDENLREKQRELFVTFINLAKELKLPLIIHARDAFDDAIRILEENNAKIVLMHMFGAHHLLKRVIQNGWYISMNAIVLRSKKHKKIIRDAPLERIMLETDSPWLSPVQLTQGIKTRNDPTSVKVIAQRIAEIKKIPVEEVAEITTKNAINFFKLPIK